MQSLPIVGICNADFADSAYEPSDSLMYETSVTNAKEDCVACDTGGSPSFDVGVCRTMYDKLLEAFKEV